MQQLSQTELNPLRRQSQGGSFLHQNWRATLAHDCPAEQRYIRVEDDVATICNRALSIRVPVAAPDGFYLLNDAGALVPVMHSIAWQAYPDRLSMYQDFSKAVWSAPISHDLAREFVVWVEMVRKVPKTVYFDKIGAFTPGEGPRFDFATMIGAELPLSGEELAFDAYQLKLAFTEMLRYDYFYLGREVRPHGDGPLVIGHDWSRCAMIIPRRWTN